MPDPPTRRDMRRLTEAANRPKLSNVKDSGYTGLGLLLTVTQAPVRGRFQRLSVGIFALWPSWLRGDLVVTVWQLRNDRFLPPKYANRQL